MEEVLRRLLLRLVVHFHEVELHVHISHILSHVVLQTAGLERVGYRLVESSFRLDASFALHLPFD